MAARVRPYVTFSIAFAGAGAWLATSHDAPVPFAAPAVQLASVGSPMPLSPMPLSPMPLSPADAACGDLLCTTLFGPAVSAPSPHALAAPDIPAAPSPNPIGALISALTYP
jgi:hypothetical protein